MEKPDLAAPSRSVNDDHRLTLPAAPDSETGAVKAWSEPVDLLTYAPAPPDTNPMFLEKRVYQGSNGRVYPLPVIDRIETVPEVRAWQAIHLENGHIRLMVLPEIGGRIHIGLDKATGYDFFYRQNVIKPALVGLAGPWASGGVEFNWPQHHRPATYMPVNVEIERSSDGSVTVWCGDYDPMDRLKGMHGLCLHPDKTYLELRVRLYNRTMDTKTFLWWANVAVHVDEQYQSFFPGDVRLVADHAKRAATEFPLSHGAYYGIEYGKRVLDGVTEAERPTSYFSDGSYEPNDLSWFANIPVPTSYMVCGSQGDFSGGYDHKHNAGLVSVVNHHIAPGKKQWTWGNHAFGDAWHRNLTESDGPYIELMVGAYTDNQPDFSFLAPGETKVFSHFWYPLRGIGVPSIANVDAALRLTTAHRQVTVHVQVTSTRPGSTIRLLSSGREMGSWHSDLLPANPLHHSFDVDSSSGPWEVRVEQNDALLLRYAPSEIESADSMEVATEPAMPEDVTTSDELFLIGLHLEQYRHPTRYPELYWREGVRRDPEDSRMNHAVGRWHLRRGEFDQAEAYLRTSLRRLLLRNPNPYDGEPHYNLGLTLLYQQRTDEAYEVLYKSTWNAAWRGPAHLGLAEIDCSRKSWTNALDHVDRSLRADADNLNARNLKTLILTALGRADDAHSLLSATTALDPLDIYSRFLSTREVPVDGQQRLDLALDLMRAGFLSQALQVLIAPRPAANDGTAAMILYAKAAVLHYMGDLDGSHQTYAEAARASSDYVFPSRLEEMLLLRRALDANPADARAPYYLGNLLYDRQRHREAIELWEQSTHLDSNFPTAWRNLGFGYFNVLHDSDAAVAAFRKAFELAPNDPRILFEYDQLLKRINTPLSNRLATLQKHGEQILFRDDLSVEFASLLNSTDDPTGALELLLSRQFQPWEGGEGLVLAQYVRAHILLAKQALSRHDGRTALDHLLAANDPPLNLSEVRHPLSSRSNIDYWLGCAYAELERLEEARCAWESAARSQADFQQMQVHAVSDTTFWCGMALQKLGRIADAQRLFKEIEVFAEELQEQHARIDYFATSLPTMLLFDEDLQDRQRIRSTFLLAQAHLGMGEHGYAKGIAELHSVLTRDCSHTGAMDLLRTFRG